MQTKEGLTKKIVRGKRDGGDLTEGSQTGLHAAGSLLLAKSPTRLQLRHPPISLSPPPLNRLPPAPEYILPLPVSSEGEIFAESAWLPNNVGCSLLPGPCRDQQDCGRSSRDTERSCTYTHIDIFTQYVYFENQTGNRLG